MAFPVTCPACGKAFQLATEIYERKVAGKIVSIKCKQCQAGIRVDATKPGELKVVGATPAGGSGDVSVGPKPPEAPKAAPAAGAERAATRAHAHATADADRHGESPGRATEAARCAAGACSGPGSSERARSLGDRQRRHRATIASSTKTKFDARSKRADSRCRRSPGATAWPSGSRSKRSRSFVRSWRSRARHRSRRRALPSDGRPRPKCREPKCRPRASRTRRTAKTRWCTTAPRRTRRSSRSPHPIRTRPCA